MAVPQCRPSSTITIRSTSTKGKRLTDISTAWKTDKGPRPANEDSCFVLTHDELGGVADGLLVVADGMGGRASGATASRLAVEAVRRTFTSGQTDGDLGGLLSRSLIDANSDVIREAGTRPEFQGMGTTCVAAAIKGDRLFIANVGDSRGYLLRDGRLLRLTEDHSIVAEKVRSGEMTEEQARKSRFRNVITRAIGLEESVEPEMSVTDLRPRDVVILCSDGLTGPVRESEIAEIVGSSESVDEACDRLVKAALKSGGSDNVTVALMAYGRSGDRVSSLAPGIGRKLARILVPGLIGLVIGLVIGAALGIDAEDFPLLRDLHREHIPVAVPFRPPDLKSLEYGIPTSLLYTPLQGDVLRFRKGRLTVAEKNGTLREVDKAGRVTQGLLIDDVGQRTRLLSSTKAVDWQGNLYVSDRKNKCILKFDADGKPLKTIGEGQLIGPEALVVDKNGDIYVIDGGRLKVIHPKPVPSVPSVP